MLSPEEITTQRQFRFQPKTSYPKTRGRLSQKTVVRIRSNSKVTIPKPFQMMLREEERKKHKVRTRSEIELENTLLRRELEELQECQKKFRASPAPAHIHLPLYEIISRRFTQRSSRTRHQADAGASQQPFNFLERERRKKEAKIMAELGRLRPKEEHRTFKARPMPRSVYGKRQKADVNLSGRQPQFVTICTLEREATDDQSSDSEADVLSSKSDASPDSSSAQRCSACKPVKKQIQLSIEMVKESEWSYKEQVKAATCSIYSPVQQDGPETALLDKGDYISV